ncbi:MAG: c-type cytochrome [Burkholderiales bacterium]|jgi:cytochrome c peroxidase|nr:c-type cytochrome [Burkholderiales bacterium]
MTRRFLPLALGAIAAVAALIGLSAPVRAGADDDALLETARALFAPLPTDYATAERPITPERVALGRMLFHETRVSADGAVSCARCHLAALHGTDGLPRSIGVHGKALPRNASTVLNTAGQFVQHFGGNRADVEEQAARALLSPFAYGNPDHATAMARLAAIPGYRPLFEAAFPGDPDPVSARNWSLAIGAFERTLATPGPFDRWLAGDTRALSPSARAGLATFVETGCAACHNGPLLGGRTYQRFGITMDYWQATGSERVDQGRFEDTKNDADRLMFKVPPLRNIARTAPYFHDGSVATLGDAIRVMARTQLGRTPGDADVARIEAFLEALTGEVPAHFREAPTLPPGAFTAAR